MKFPKPGKPVRGSKSGSSIMALFDLLGRSWALGVIWQLKEGACTFRQLQERCESVPPATLNKRIKELTEARLIERIVHGYILTNEGKDLLNRIKPLKEWSYVWAEKFKEED